MSWSNQQSAPIFAFKIKEINSALPAAKLNCDPIVIFGPDNRDKVGINTW
jgi:hypothetical protein